VVPVVQRDALTWADRAGAWPEAVLGLLGAAAVAFAVARSTAHERSPRQQQGILPGENPRTLEDA
jgi:hypothetical protein